MRKTLLLAISLLCIKAQLSGQQFDLQNYSVKDGLAQSQVHTIFSDTRGFIWLGTQGGGLSRFDGLNFQNYDVSDGLPGNYIEAIYEDGQGCIWIGTQRGLCRYDGWSFEKLKLPGEAIRTVNAFLETDSLLWIGTDRGVIQYDGVKFIYYSLLNKLPLSKVNALVQDTKGKVWIGHQRGLIEIAHQQRASYSSRSATLVNHEKFHLKAVTSLFARTDGSLVIGTEKNGVYIQDGAKWTVLDQNKGLASERIQCLAGGQNDEIWIGTQDQGISIYHSFDSTFTYLNINDGLPEDDIRGIIQDSWGNRWIATSGGGFSKYTGQRFVHFGRKQGLEESEVYALAEDNRGGIWFSTIQGLYHYNGFSFSYYYLGVKSRSLLVDDNSNLWIGTEGRGLGLYNGKKFLFYQTDHGLGSNWINDIVRDGYGDYWIATAASGITRMNIDSVIRVTDTLNGPDSIEVVFGFQRFTRQDGLPENRVNCLATDHRGKLWFGTRTQGLAYIDIKQERVQKIFRARDGLASDHIRTLLVDSGGAIWAGTSADGLSWLKEVGDSLEIVNYSRTDGLSSNKINSLISDEEKNLWVGNHLGVDKLELDAEGKLKRVESYGLSEGFTGQETTQNAVLQDRSGQLWFGTLNGLMKYIPGALKKNPVPPKIHFSDVKLFYESIRHTPYAGWAQPWNGLADGLRLPHRQNSLGFEFVGINHFSPGQVFYQWQLIGQETEWSPIQTDNKKSYSNLRPGLYTFQVRALNEDGIYSEPAMKVSFEILPPFWQLWWFRCGLVGLTILLVFMGIRVWSNRIKSRARQERERLEMEKHLLSLEQKALQLQMNPHFIFNALNSIQYLIGQKDHKTARYQLAKFAKLMRGILENSRSSYISLAEEMATLDHYLALERFSRNDSFDYYIHLEPGVDPELLRIPPMLIQPFVENAAIHGVAHRKEKGLITVTFKKRKDLLECTIEDNGIGRQASATRQSQLDHRHSSTAIAVTQERINLLHGRGSLTIDDVIGDSGEVKGTRVIIGIPLSEI